MKSALKMTYGKYYYTITPSFSDYAYSVQFDLNSIYTGTNTSRGTKRYVRCFKN